MIPITNNPNDLTRFANPNVVVIGDSITSNSLGRALSMTLTARHRYETKLWAIDDGPMWDGAAQFADGVQSVPKRSWRRHIARHINSSDGVTVFWISKMSAPTHLITQYCRDLPNCRVIVDIDDDDVEIMRSFLSLSITNKLRVPPWHRKYPQRLVRSQHFATKHADALSFSSQTLLDEIKPRLAYDSKPTAIVPHTRPEEQLDHSSYPPDAEWPRSIVFGFPGTIRAHKGADTLVSLLRASSESTLHTFKQSFRPPADVARRWIEHPPGYPLSELYQAVDLLLLPMSLTSMASLRQLPAKLVDAGRWATPVAATPTPPILEFAANSVIAVGDWSDASAVLHQIRQTDRLHSARAMHETFRQHFSTAATSHQLEKLINHVL